MPFEQTITIINNSGKIISTGKHLVGIFKEARSAYKEKKEALRQERHFSYRRANTFNATGSGGYNSYHGPIVEEYEDGTARYDNYDVDYHRNHRAVGPRPEPLYLESRRGDRRSNASLSGRRRHRSHRTVVGGDGDSVHGDCQPSRPQLTASNLSTLSDMSASHPPVVPPTRRHLHEPHSGPAPRDVAPSREVLGSEYNSQSSARLGNSADAALPSVRASMMVHRSRSDPVLRLHTGGGGGAGTSSSKPIDMSLAYGDIPPDLESRFDLDTAISGDDEPDNQQESQAQTLVDRIETLLNEAQCLHHTAASIICRLQDNPEAAAAVALTLAELSSILARLSPAFLGAVKGGSPVVFALLASPQFLIGTSIAVGVTVILFGGWKIIKRISEVRASQKDEKLAFESAGQFQSKQQTDSGPSLGPPLAASVVPALTPAVYDEALVLEEELSTIESWRRGIELDEDVGTEPWGGSEAEVELISPEAMRSRVGDDDQRTLRSTRTSKSHGNKSHRRSKHHGASTLREDNTAPKQDSKDLQSVDVSKTQGHHRRHGNDAASDAGSVRSRHSSRHSGRSHRSKGVDPNGDGAGASTARSQTAASDAGSAPSREGRNLVSGSGNMLKQLFKKKRIKDDKDRQDAISVLV
ncbi:hypothetical protein SEPCBS57363_005810 [Sporothrix epigloea]|uniref:Uncharacterized protein n=1 Tax=Sporothrix epigloea TaxID=1892477 RepID=A0ABP0DZL9_9PEZI